MRWFAMVVAVAMPLRFAAAQVCTVVTAGLAFGVYDPQASSGTATTGTVSVSCTATVAAGVAYSIQIGTGGSGNYASRRLTTGTATLAYQLYTSAARTSVWGDGSAGTGVVSDSFGLPALGSVSRTYTAYGLIGPMQRASPGTYADVVTMLINY